MTLNDVNTLEETADYLRIKPDLLARLARRKEIASLKQGLHLTFTREGIEEYKKTHETPALAPNPFGLSPRSAARLSSRRSLPTERTQ